ncbi:MAG: BrnT family toxin [Blastocatellia bacterium]
MGVKVDWGNKKAALNLAEHGISFEEASTVFDDPLTRIFDDDDHSIDELREIAIGYSIIGDLLLVCFTERANDVLRIISARFPTKKERRKYEENS